MQKVFYGRIWGLASFELHFRELSAWYTLEDHLSHGCLAFMAAQKHVHLQERSCG